MNLLIVIACSAVFVAMTILWLIQLRTKNAGWVDWLWTLSITFLAVAYAFIKPLDDIRSAIFLGMISFWGLRLSTHLFIRLSRDPHEDSRYADIRSRWGKYLQVKFFFLYQFQAIIAIIFSIPFYLVFSAPSRSVGYLEMMAMMLWFGGVVGETIADHQLANFKMDATNKGKVCDVGLWNYSRHPNYFFEWIIWIAYGLYAFSNPNGWIAMAAPALMLFLLLFVSGVPLAEKLSLRSRGEAYRRYQETTSVFVPWFKRKKL